MKTKIGILDAGMEGLSIFNKLVLNFPYNKFIYVNDMENYPYEGKNPEDIKSLTSELINTLYKQEVDIIIVLSNSIIEYCDELLSNIKIPIIKINDLIINYVNKNYEYKNIALLAKLYILKASTIYQKNFHYNHLYNVQSDELDELVLNKEVKTGKSFGVCQRVLKNAIGKDVDLVVYVDSFISTLLIEIKEYIPNTSYIDLYNIIIDYYKENLLDKYPFAIKGKEASLVISNMEKDEFKKLAYFVNCKYDYIKR